MSHRAWMDTSRGAYCQMIHDVNKEKRLASARENKEDDFSDCIYSDETSVQIETHRWFCCTKSGLKPRYKPRPMHPTNVRVWAAISIKGRSGICILNGCMDAVAHASILERTLLPMIEKLYPNGHWFVQDNYPKHTSAWAQQFLMDRGINWWCTPPESPKYNPIENLWSISKIVAGKLFCPTSHWLWSLSLVKVLQPGKSSWWRSSLLLSNTLDVPRSCSLSGHTRSSFTALPKIVDTLHL